MPIYEYTCPDCNHDFEKIVRVGAPAPPCPECSGTDVAKKVSLSAFHLKGGGWYSDAYAGKDNKVPSKGGSSDAKPAASPASDSASSDAKPSPSTSTPKAAPAATSTTKSAT